MSVKIEVEIKASIENGYMSTPPFVLAEVVRLVLPDVQKISQLGADALAELTHRLHALLIDAESEANRQALAVEQLNQREAQSAKQD